MFARGSFPNDIASSQPDPSANWGPPTSLFTGNFSMDDHFKNLSIVFDTTFCGDWAGAVWSTPGSACAALAPTCEQYVSDNPNAFAEAYWAINTLQVFQDDSDGTPKAAVATQGQKQVSTAVDAGGDGYADAGANDEKPKGRFIKSMNNLRRAASQIVKSKRWIDSQQEEEQSNQTPRKREWRRRSGGAVLPSI